MTFSCTEDEVRLMIVDSTPKEVSRLVAVHIARHGYDQAIESNGEGIWRRGKVYTVSKRKKGGWKVEGSDLGVFGKGDTKEEVVQAATSLANLQKKATLRIEKEDGELQEERTYSREHHSRAPRTSSHRS